MANHHHYQLVGSAPELYQKYLVPAITTKWAEDLIGRARPRAGEAVLDIACGTGVVARLAGSRMAQGHVTGLGACPDRHCDGHLLQVNRLRLPLRG